MSPHYGDHIKKERDALNLIIRMKRSNQMSGGGELIFFVLVPLVMAFAIMHYRDIFVFCYKSQWISAAIKVVYPAWKWEGDATAPAGPAQTTAGAEGLPSAAGEAPNATGTGAAPGVVDGSAATAVVPPGQVSSTASAVNSVEAASPPASTTAPHASPPAAQAPTRPAHTSFPSNSSPFQSEPLRSGPGSPSEPN